MELEGLSKIKNTLLVILRERNQPSEIALLGLVNRWEPEEVESNDSYERDRLWDLKLFLPAQAYARSSNGLFSEASKVIRSTLNEVVSAQRDRFISVDFFPELVDKLSFSQDELMEWLDEAKEQGLISA